MFNFSFGISLEIHKVEHGSHLRNLRMLIFRMDFRPVLVTLRYGLVFEINRENLIMYASIIIKYAQFVLKMKFSSKLQACDFFVEYLRLLISFEQRILCLFFIFCSAKITVKVINEYILEQYRKHTQARDINVTYV